MLFTHKAPSNFLLQMTFQIFFIFFIENKSDILCESSAKQTIHMKCQNLFSTKNKQKVLSAVDVTGTFRFKLYVPLGSYWRN